MTLKRLPLLVALFVAPMVATAAERPVTDGQARVLDGGTLQIGGERFRLFAVDAPEMSDPRGPVARAALDDLVAGREVSCAPTGATSYGRQVARCVVEGRDLGAAMIGGGHAFASRSHTEEYDRAEAEARRGGRGFWAGAKAVKAGKDAWDIAAALGPFFGAFLGLVALLVAAWYAAKLNRKQRHEDHLAEMARLTEQHRLDVERQEKALEDERVALMSAVYGEVMGILAAINAREYENIFHKSATEWREYAKMGPANPRPRLPFIPVRENYFVVFEATAHRLGLIKAPLPEGITLFYLMVRSAKEDFQSLVDGLWTNQPADDVVEMLDGVHTLLVELRELGQNLCLRLGKATGIDVRAIEDLFARVNARFVDRTAAPRHPEPAAAD